MLDGGDGVIILMPCGGLGLCHLNDGVGRCCHSRGRRPVQLLFPPCPAPVSRQEAMAAKVWAQRQHRLQCCLQLHLHNLNHNLNHHRHLHRKTADSSASVSVTVHRVPMPILHHRDHSPLNHRSSAHAQASSRSLSRTTSQPLPSPL